MFFSDNTLKNKIFISSFLAIFIFTFCSFASEDKIITAKVDKDRVNTGEVFTYTLKIKGELLKPNLILPKFKNFRIVSRRQSQSYSTQKGKFLFSFILVYHLFAPEAGIFTISPAIIKDGRKVYKSRSITIRVEGKSLKEKNKILPYIKKGINI